MAAANSPYLVSHTLLRTLMDHITGTSIIKLMRLHRKTIRGLAEAMGVTLTRVREVRANGVRGVAFVQDWMQAITGNHKAGWEEVARSYVHVRELETNAPKQKPQVVRTGSLQRHRALS